MEKSGRCDRLTRGSGMLVGGHLHQQRQLLTFGQRYGHARCLTQTGRGTCRLPGRLDGAADAVAAARTEGRRAARTSAAAAHTTTSTAAAAANHRRRYVTRRQTSTTFRRRQLLVYT